MSARCGWVLGALLAASAAANAETAAAETAYVTDMLRLGLHHADDTSDAPFETLLSGTALEVLERTVFYARVRTPDGAEGWVKSAYLVSEEPPRARLNALEARVAELEAEAQAAEAASAAAILDAERMTKEAAASLAATEANRERLARLERDNAEYERRLAGGRGRVPLAWAGAALAVALGAGIALGIWWLDAVIRRRHGGYRVY